MNKQVFFWAIFGLSAFAASQTVEQVDKIVSDGPKQQVEQRVFPPNFPSSGPATQANQMVSARWSEAQAQQWGKENGWLCGSNFNPSTAINQLEMWQVESFDTVTVNRELGWAESIGMNVMRVYLHHLAWQIDREGFKKRMDTYLDISDKHGIKTIFVFFDDCWNPSYASGKQPDPKSGVHNSGWIRDPGDLLFTDTTLIKTLESYVKDVLTTFKDVKRIVMWDLYNEPGNSDYNNKSLPLLKKVFEWGWQVRPSQPLSSGTYNGKENDKIQKIKRFQVDNSDIITYHNYDGPEQHQKLIDSLNEHNRPLVCTEYLARKYNSLFTNITPMLKKQNIGAINWGLVTGKTNTKYTWGEVVSDGSDPELWLHDILYQNGKPFNQEEVDLIQCLNGK